jgi:hypothetical protein
MMKMIGATAQDVKLPERRNGAMRRERMSQNEERDKFLTEAMGECWHEHLVKTGTFSTLCNKCLAHVTNNDFSTWPGFGKLWEWAQKQEWFNIFMLGKGWLIWPETQSPFMVQQSYFNLIHPDRFADVLFAFLKERNP